MKKNLSDVRIKDNLIKICILGVLLFVFAYPMRAFAEIRYKDPLDEGLKKILEKPDKTAVEQAKSRQSFTFQMGKTIMAGCLVCHSDKYLTKVDSNGEKMSLYVDPKKFSQSVHAEVGCVGCHIGWGLQAHKPPMTDNWRQVARLACKNCHKYEFSLYSKSRHYELVKTGKKVEAEHGEGDMIRGPTCFDCHGNHAIVKARAENSPVAARNAPEEVCGKCHKYRLETYLNNYMGKTLVFLDNDRAPSCFECHGNHDVKNLENMDDAIKACRGCHKTANKVMVEGFIIHADEKSFEAFPVQYITYMGMALLIAGVLGFIYPLTFLLTIRNYFEYKKHSKKHSKKH